MSQEDQAQVVRKPFPFQPIGDVVVIEVVEEAKSQKIIAPGNRKQRDLAAGIVIGVGKGLRSIVTGTHVPLDVKIGDKVVVIAQMLNALDQAVRYHLIDAGAEADYLDKVAIVRIENVIGVIGLPETEQDSGYTGILPDGTVLPNAATMAHINTFLGKPPQGQ